MIGDGSVLWNTINTATGVTFLIMTQTTNVYTNIKNCAHVHQRSF